MNGYQVNWRRGIALTQGKQARIPLCNELTLWVKNLLRHSGDGWNARRLPTVRQRTNR